jgi:hypothetical protein
MRTIKRLLLSAKELSIFLLGIILSLVLAVRVEEWWVYRYLDRHVPLTVVLVPTFVLFSGVLLTSLVLSWVRRKHAPRKFAYDVAGWALDHAERKLHPRRRKFKRLFTGMLVSLPSALAMLVLFFFPVASHLQHPGSRYFQHYRIPVPWSVTVFPAWGPDGGDNVSAFAGIISSNTWSRFGITTFWDSESLSAIVTFGTRRRSDDTSDVPMSVRLGETVDLSRREFRSNSLTLTCWQWRYSSYALGRQSRNELVWSVACRAPADVDQRQIEASFYGREESIPDFYRIVEGVAFVK